MSVIQNSYSVKALAVSGVEGYKLGCKGTKIAETIYICCNEFSGILHILYS